MPLLNAMPLNPHFYFSIMVWINIIFIIYVIITRS